MPSMKLEDALLEQDEDLEIREQVENIVAYNTCDPEMIACFKEMEEAHAIHVRLMREKFDMDEECDKYMADTREDYD